MKLFTDWARSEKQSLKYGAPLIVLGVVLVTLGIEVWAPLAIGGVVVLFIAALFFAHWLP